VDLRERTKERETAERVGPHSTWWDRRDDPPRALTTTVVRASNVLGRLTRPGEAPEAAESKRALLVRTALLAVTFLVVVWLILAAILEQA
jgi:hypothetical protein